jgi:hypothetical protein
MTSDKKSKSNTVKRNVVESLKDLGDDFGAQSVDLLKSTSEDFFKELIGISNTSVNKSGEMSPGESIQVANGASERENENKKLRAQVLLERNNANEERSLTEQKMQELRVQLQAISNEINKLAMSTSALATQTEIAMVEVPVNPGVYHIIFFEKVLEFLQSFRKKIDQATVWLQSSNKRAEKKNYWAMYKKKGSSFLLSPDHYLSRSAG